MFLPLSDAPNPRRVPVATYGLIAVNVLVYLLVNVPLGARPADRSDPALAAYVETVRETLPANVPVDEVIDSVSAYDLFVFEHGFRPAAPQVVDLFTSMFLHGGIMHLFGNMLFLWIYGDNVEYRLGRLRYLFWYLATGAAATLFFMLFSPGSGIPLVGASGAISGVLGFYFLWFPRNVVRVLVFLFPFLMKVVAIPARIVLGIFLVIDNVLPFLFTSGGSGSGVAHGAHIGGFVAGLAVAWLLDRREVNAAPTDYPGAPSAAVPADAVAAAIAAGDMAGAAKAYFALPAAATRRVLEPEASIALGNWLAANGHAEAALVLFRRHLRDYPAGPGVAEAHVGAGTILLGVQGQPTPAYQHFLEALEARPSPAVAEQARRGIEAVRGEQKYPMRAYSPRE